MIVDLEHDVNHTLSEESYLDALKVHMVVDSCVFLLAGIPQRTNLSPANMVQANQPGCLQCASYPLRKKYGLL